MVKYPRMQRFRAKKAANDPEFRKKESERFKALRQKKKDTMTLEEKEENKVYRRNYMKIYRKKKKIENILIKATQALGEKSGEIIESHQLDKNMLLEQAVLNQGSSPAKATPPNADKIGVDLNGTRTLLLTDAITNYDIR